MLLIITKILSLLKLKKLERTRKRKSYYFEAVVPLGVRCFNLRINFFSNQNPHTPSSPPYNTNALYLQNPLSLHSTTNSNRFLSLSVTVAVAVSLSVSTVASIHQIAAIILTTTHPSNRSDLTNQDG
jgi:hypothetical protein